MRATWQFADARARLALAAVALVAVACTTLPVRPLSPKVTLSQVRVVRLQPAGVALRVTLDVDNPNPYPLAVAALDAAITVNGVPLADVKLPAPVTLSASAATGVDIDVTTTLDRAIEALRRGDGGAGALPYEVTGTAMLGDGVRLPFSRRGALPLPEWARMLTR
jgi:LEA14-like dessication related protein